jgi:nucleoside-diphosphate-sugar epimerase
LQRLVFASTSEVYAASLASFDIPIPTPESTPLTVGELGSPRSSYMLSKIYGEAIVSQSGLPITILRPHNVYGPRMGMAHVIPELLRKAHEAPDGGALEVYSVDHRRTFCYVADAVEMLHRVALNPACEGQTLNLGAQRPEISIADLARRVIAVTGRRLEISPMPPTPGSPLRRCPDMSKLAALTGYEAQVNLDTGIEATYAWYREREFAVAVP